MRAVAKCLHQYLPSQPHGASHSGEDGHDYDWHSKFGSIHSQFSHTVTYLEGERCDTFSSRLCHGQRLLIEGTHGRKGRPSSHG